MTAPIEEVGIPFGTQLGRLAAADPDGIGLVLIHREAADEPVSWRELDRRSNQWCRTLQSRGAGVGDRVALAVQNSVDLIVAILGCWKAGASPVPVRWDLPDWERDRVLVVVDATVVVDSSSLAALRDQAAAEDDGPVEELVAPKINGICSSGATGTPKVIMSTRPGEWVPSMSDPFMTNWEPVERPQVILVMAPMYHTNGFATLNFLLGGDRLVVMEKFDAPTVVDVIERHRITNFTATPTMLQRIAAVPGIESRDLSSVAWILQGAAMMPPSLLRTWMDLLAPHKVVMAYGMTEQLGLTSLRGDDWLDHQGSVGRGFRDTEVRILDDDGNEVPAGEIGNVYMRWPSTGAYEYRGGAALLPTTPDGFGTAGDLG